MSSDERKASISVRDMKPEDINFVLATFLRGLYYGNSWFSLIPKPIFMGSYHGILERLIASPNVTTKVACLKDDEDVILGYTVYTQTAAGTALHWTFVKDAWRNIGIAKMLLPKNVIYVTHLTKVGKSMMHKLNGAQFNPFLI